MAFMVESVVPILRTFDEPRAREFYVGYLGCTVDWEHRFDGQGPLDRSFEPTPMLPDVR